MWFAIGVEARKEPSSTEINFDGRRGVIHISTTVLVGYLVFDDFKATARRLVDTAMHIVKDMLPAECHEALDTLPTTLFQCAGKTSVFQQEKNAEVFTRLTDSLRQAFSAPREGSKRSAASVIQVKDLLNRCAKLQEYLSAAIAYTMGVTARAWQLCEFVYTGEDCNILLTGQQVLLAFPKAKQKELIIYAVAWVLPHCLGKAVLAYWGVVRPLEIELLKWLGNKGPGTDVLRKCHERYMFARIAPPKEVTARTQWRWTTGILNEVLKLLGLGLSCGVLRHLTVAILREDHPDVIPDHTSKGKGKGKGKEDAVDAQAQHTKAVGDVHYGANAITKRSTLPPAEINKVLALSRTYHRILEFIPSELHPPKMTLFSVDIRQVLSIAGLAVHRTYGEASKSTDPSQIKKYALENKPWSKLPEVRAGPLLNSLRPYP